MSEQNDNREKVAQKIYSMNKITPVAMARPCTWDELLECTRENFRKQADKIIAIIPVMEDATQLAFENGYAEGQQRSIETDAKLVEEAKMQEREKMINWLNGYCDRHEQPYNGHCHEGKRIAKRKDCYECWQALVKK